MLERQVFEAGAVSGVRLWANFSTQLIGSIQGSASRAVFVSAVGILLVPLLLARRAKVRAGKWPATGVAVAGLMALGWRGLSFDAAEGCMLVSSVAFALYVIRCGGGGVPADAAGCGGAVAQRGGLLGGRRWRIGYLSLAVTVATLLLLPLAQRFVNAQRTVVIVAWEPCFAALGANLLWGEELTVRVSAVGLLIVLGVLLCQLTPASHKLNVQQVAL